MTGHATQDTPLFRSARRGKAPPVNPFDGESLDVLFEDWIPSLRRAEWNGWSERETLIQLAGHLRGRALQEWDLLAPHEKQSLQEATMYCVAGLTQVAKHWLHETSAIQHSKKESLCQISSAGLNSLFKLAYSQDGTSEETRGTLLHSQLQEGLHYEIMKASAVSGSHGYKELCLALRNEEKRLAEPAKQWQYQKPLQESTQKKAPREDAPSDPSPCDQTGQRELWSSRPE